MSEEIKNVEETPAEAVETSAPAAEETKPAAAEETKPAATEETRPAAPAEEQQHRKPYTRERGKFRKKVCRFCHDKDLPLDYKRSDILERFITDRGKILPRRVTGTCAKHQRQVAREIKRARIIALLPFVEK